MRTWNMGVGSEAVLRRVDDRRTRLRGASASTSLGANCRFRGMLILGCGRKIFDLIVDRFADCLNALRSDGTHLSAQLQGRGCRSLSYAVQKFDQSVLRKITSTIYNDINQNQELSFKG